VSVKPRSVRIVGSATFTIVPSRITISWVTRRTSRAPDRRRSVVVVVLMNRTIPNSFV
jgi:hypothetical protein